MVISSAEARHVVYTRTKRSADEEVDRDGRHGHGNIVDGDLL